MMKPAEQFAGGVLSSCESGGDVSANVAQSRSSALNFITGLCHALESLVVGLPLLAEDSRSAVSTTTNCDSLPARGQKIGERGGGLARRRYQKGRVFLRGKKNLVWVGRWREDEIKDGVIRRPERSEVLGSKADFPTKRLAQRELDRRLAVVNDPRYRARPTATFAEFSARWEVRVLTQHKPSTQITIRSHIRKHLNPFFGQRQLKDIGSEEIQCFISSVKASPKTKKNLFATFQMVWKSARTWGYVAHDAVSGVVLPRRDRVARRFFSLNEVQRILEAAPEPLQTFLWLAVETGMRAGELCGLRVRDIDFDRSTVHVCQSAWRGKIQSPKSERAVRCFALSPRILARLAGYCGAWAPNEAGLLFATRNGTPWDANLLVKRKLYPLLDSLQIERGGLHAFRHTNSTLMDRLGVPLKVRQERLGHSDPSLTLGVYTHVASEDDFRFVEQLDGILRPNAPKKENGSGVEPPKPLYLN